MEKMNCWEAKQCGRQPGGTQEKEFGTCPATTAQKVHGINDGKNAGRACWAVGGTLCGGEIQGVFASKLGNCMKCDFYSQVRSEEANKFVSSKEILKMLN